jgi:tRNA pseudouridine38-40 synthase
MGELKKAGWGRGARTDKGVHALSNGVSVKLAISEDYLLPGSPI